MGEIVRNYKLLFLFAFIIGSTSCNWAHKNTEDLKQIVNHNLGKEIIIPTNMHAYSLNQELYQDSSWIFNADLKILTHINGSCPICINNLEFWDKFSKEKQFADVPVILFCTSKDSFEIIQYLSETEAIPQLSYPLFFDVNNEFVQKNSFMSYSDHLETVLVDKRNRILLFGNPIMGDKIKEMYKEIIQKHLDSNGS